MRGQHDRDANYPLTVQPRTGGEWEVLNLESSESLGVYPTIQEATTVLDDARNARAARIEAQKNAAA